MKYHHTFYDIKDLLAKNDCWFKVFEHAPVRTSEEAAQVRPDYELRQGAKAMIVKAKPRAGDNQFFMLVLPGDKRFDNRKVKQVLNTKKFRFATPEEIAALTADIKPGGVPPFGNLFNLEVIADPALFENEKIIFNAGDRRASIAMKSSDYQKLVQPKTAPIS